MDKDQLENPVLGYVVIAAALLAGMLSVTVFAESPMTELPGLVADVEVASDDGHQHDDVKHESPEPSSCLSDDEAVGAAHVDAGEDEKHRPRRWILGVRSTSTATGCVITSVIESSAAKQAGLAVGDRILAVDGKQVGWIGRKRVPLHRAVDSSPTRQLCLLVQRSGSGALQSLRLKLKTLPESLGH